MKRTLLVLMIAVGSVASAQTQSGGPYTIEKSVISNGGGTSIGGVYQLEGTIGQAIAGGQATSPPYSLQSGFWNFDLAPTAAEVSISGRVTAMGRSVQGAVVIVSLGDGTVRRARTNTLGYFSIEGLTAGETVIVTARHGRFQFSPQLVNVFDSITGFEIRAL